MTDSRAPWAQMLFGPFLSATPSWKLELWVWRHWLGNDRRKKKEKKIRGHPQWNILYDTDSFSVYRPLWTLMFHLGSKTIVLMGQQTTAVWHEGILCLQTDLCVSKWKEKKKGKKKNIAATQSSDLMSAGFIFKPFFLIAHFNFD